MQKLESIYEHLWNNPPPAFNPDYQPNSDKLHRSLSDYMASQELIAPCKDRIERKLRYKAKYDLLAAELYSNKGAK